MSEEHKDLERRILCKLDLSCGSVRFTQSGIIVDVNRLSSACKTEPCAANGEQIRLEISPEVTTKLDVLEGINTGGEGRGDSNGASNHAKGLRHFQGNELFKR